MNVSETAELSILQRLWLSALLLLGVGAAVSNSLAGSAYLVALGLVVLSGRAWRERGGRGRGADFWLLLLYAIWTLGGLIILAPAWPDLSAALARWTLLFATLLAMTGSGALIVPLRWLRFIEGAVVLALAVLWASCLYQYHQLGWIRVIGFHKNPNFLAAALLPPLVYFGERCLAALQTRSRRWFFIYGATTLLVVHALLLTGTRTALPVLALYLVAFAVRFLVSPWASVGRRRSWFVLLGGLLVAVGLYLGEQLWARVNLDYMLRDDAILSRFEIWRLNFDRFLASPIWGTGFMQNYLAVEDHASLQPFMNNSIRGLLAHNTYLQVLTESGAVGLVLFLGFLLAIFIKTPRMRWFVTIILVAGLTDTMLHLNRAQPALLFFVALSFLGTPLWKPHSKIS